MTDEEARAWVAKEWEAAKPHIQRAVDRAEGAFDIEHVRAEIEAGRAQLWGGLNAAVVTKLETYPSGIKACLFWLCGGDDMNEILDIEAKVSAWAARQGCHRVEIIGRRGWLRALKGYRETSTLLVREILE